MCHRRWSRRLFAAAVEGRYLSESRGSPQLNFKIPAAVRILLGTNVRQLGFSVAYIRVADGVWFPVSYGTEFRLDLFWGYKRTITMAMESAGFRKANATSKIEYQLGEQ